MSNRMDLEQICSHTIFCIIRLETVVENTLNVLHSNTDIQDVNDNTPKFSRSTTELNI